MYWSGSDLHIEEIAVQNEQKIVSDIWTHSTGKSSQFWARKKLVSSETSEIGHVLGFKKQYSELQVSTNKWDEFKPDIMKHNVGTMCWHISNTLSSRDVNAKHE